MRNHSSFPPRGPQIVGPRRGFSLMELFIVITILSMITLIAFPMLRRPLNESVVQDAGQQLLHDLAAARTAAIESGRPIIFQFQIGSGQYYIGEQDQRLDNPIGSESDADAPPGLLPEAATKSSLGNSPGRNSQENKRPAPLKLRRELPADVTFVDTGLEEARSAKSAFSNRPSGTETGRERQKRVDDINAENLSPEERTPRETTRSTTDENSAEPKKWSAPIRFYPSGRIKPKKIPIESPDGFRAELEIMGLAGRIRLTPPQKSRSEE